MATEFLGMEPSAHSSAATSALIEHHADRIKDAARREIDLILSKIRPVDTSGKSVEDSRDGRRPMRDKIFEKRESLLTEMVSTISPYCASRRAL